MVEELIQEFKIHGPISGLSDIGLVDCFEQVIHPWLQESIYCLEPMPTNWLEWKCKASLLDNQWRWFQDMQPKTATNWMFLFHPPPAIISTTATSSSSSQTSAPAASSVPQPMDLDRTHLMKRDPHHGLCFNCGKPGHITKVCQGPHAQNIQNVDAMTIPRLTPEDLQFLVESLRAMVTLSVPTMPPAESEGEKTPGNEGF